MDIRSGSLDFSNPIRGSGPRTSTQTVIFARPVTSAVAGLSGYTAAFQAFDDHHVGQLEVKLDTVITANVVDVVATLGVRDWSGNWDDNYLGNVEFVVLAELQSPQAVPPRSDLLITGMEFNQAVQFFRSASYLDGAHAFPDNSITQIARKATGVRVYVDYDASAGLPPINNLTGMLTVQVSNTTLQLNPINPNGAITPRPDNTIQMALANHTLNFMIPAAWCNGTATVSCQVWDQGAPGSKSSIFERTIIFTQVRPLNMYVVGVNYNAVNPNLAAPTQSQFTTQALPQLIKTYPIGDVVQSGYSTIAFDKTVTGNLGGSCTSGFSSLLDRLSDLRGGSSDIYVGVLPAGVVFTPGNQIGGCGRSGLAAVFLDFPPDLPHEVGHAFGRQHAPCTMNRCNPAPANVDGNYPQYGTFPSDSIGVFGFDPSTNSVFNPASTFDFMAYSFPQWVSAYTYAGLNGAFPATGGPGPGSMGGPVQGLGGASELLFLGLTIGRDRAVTRIPSFHFPGYGFGGERCDDFTVELLDEARQTLLCTSLHCDCDDACNCWPKEIRDAIPWQEGSRWLVVWEGEHKRYEEEIPEPPVVEVTAAKTQKDGVLVEWRARQPAGQKNAPELWYVVHWYDARAEMWRGVAPHQQERRLLIPRELFTEPELDIRVYATSGIATGMGNKHIVFDGFVAAPPQVVLVEGSSGDTVPGGTLQAFVLDSAGRQQAADQVVWYGPTGAEIGRGAQVDLRQLSTGRHVVRAVVRSTVSGMAAGAWLIERGHDAIKIINQLAAPTPARPVAPHVHPHPLPGAEEEQEDMKDVDQDIEEEPGADR